MAGRGDLLADCALHLRSSQFDFEVLLGASVTSVWKALGRHVAHQLSHRKGVSLQQFGKFGFYKTSLLPAAPVFLLADRFSSTYGVVWRQRSSPAPLTATAEVNMAALGSEAGLGSDQTRRTLEAILAFVGNTLRGGEYAGRLPLPGVGTFLLDGNTLSFTFDPSLLRTITNDQVEASPPAAIFKKSSSIIIRKEAPKAQDNTMQRSMSLDCELTTSKAIDTSQGDGFSSSNQKKEKRKHHRKLRQELQALEPSNTMAASIDNRQILPRFLIPESSDKLKTRPAHDQVLQAAYKREVAHIEHVQSVDERFNAMLADRQRVVQIRDLQQRAEQAVARQELNAFLNNQIQEKRRSRRTQKSAGCDYREMKILPLDREISDDMKRIEKQKLNQRLNEQVAAKAALKKDKRALDQAESAYFISKLKQQDTVDRQELAERKRLEKETLLAGWRQQTALRAQKMTLKL